MRKIVLSIAITGLLAACGGHEEPASQPAAPAGQEAANAPATTPRAPAPGRPIPAPEGQRGADILKAAGVELDFPHEVLYDILDASASGTRRHRVLVEVKQGKFDEVAAQFGVALQSRGYEKVSDKTTGGRIDQVYSAEGKPTYYLIMQPAGMGPKLHGKDSVGSIHIMWNIPPGGA